MLLPSHTVTPPSDLEHRYVAPPPAAAAAAYSPHRIAPSKRPPFIYIIIFSCSIFKIWCYGSIQFVGLVLLVLIVDSARVSYCLQKTE